MSVAIRLLLIGLVTLVNAQVVSGYAYKQPYSFPESELVDWLIAKPDGSEEGNVVGKFLDTYGGH